MHQADDISERSCGRCKETSCATRGSEHSSGRAKLSTRSVGDLQQFECGDKKTLSGRCCVRRRFFHDRQLGDPLVAVAGAPSVQWAIEEQRKLHRDGLNGTSWRNGDLVFVHNPGVLRWNVIINTEKVIVLPSSLRVTPDHPSTAGNPSAIGLCRSCRVVSPPLPGYIGPKARPRQRFSAFISEFREVAQSTF